MRRSESLLVMRVLLVANGVTLAALCVLYGVFGSLVVSVALGIASVGLWALVPRTDPYGGQPGARR